MHVHMDSLGSNVVSAYSGPGRSYTSFHPSFQNQMGCIGLKPCLGSYVAPAAQTNLFREKWREGEGEEVKLCMTSSPKQINKLYNLLNIE